MTDPDETFAAYCAARHHAADYHSGMGDPMYALSSSGAIVYAGVATLVRNLPDDAVLAAAWGEDGASAAFTALHDALQAAYDAAEDLHPDLSDEDDDWLAYGHAIACHLREQGLPVGPPKVERGWSRGPRYVIPRLP